MLTQCPECKTKFRVNDDQLRAAQGQVRCSRCHIIFNAHEFLQNLSTTEGSQTQKTPPDSVSDFISEADLEEFSDLKAQISNDLCPFEDSDTETIPEQPDRMIDEDLSEVIKKLERHQAKGQGQAASADKSTGPAQPETDEPEQPLPFAVPENLESITPVPQDQLDADGIFSPKKSGKKGSGWWTLGILTLLLLAISQLAWFGRDKLMRYPEGRVLFQSICEYAGCKLPLIRAPEQIQVLSRSITTHPKIESALLIQLTIANNANFSQPYPMLQIGLYSSDELLVVQRRFHPREYIPGYTKHAEFAPGKALYVELAIEDPGQDVTGFQLEFF